MREEKNLGLVLSGGGAKGAAQIGVLKAMEERGLKADIVSGTSAGAIVGALYCSGYSSDEILDFFLTTSIFRPAYYTWKKPGFLDTSALGKVLVTKFEKDSFEHLKIPLHIVATDITLAQQKVFSTGELIRPILASASFPVIFAPVEIDESLYADGGILNNFPVEPLGGHCKRVLGVNVQHIDQVEKSDLKSTFGVFQRIYSITTRFSSVSKYPLCDLVISPPQLNKFNTFDMFKIKTMYEIGYEEACKVFDSTKDLDKWKSGSE